MLARHDSSLFSITSPYSWPNDSSLLRLNRCYRISIGALSVKWNKKSQHVLFVEDEEAYNWATARNSVNRKLVYVSILFVVAAILFSAVR